MFITLHSHRISSKYSILKVVSIKIRIYLTKPLKDYKVQMLPTHENWFSSNKGKIKKEKKTKSTKSRSYFLKNERERERGEIRLKIKVKIFGK